MKAGAFQTDRLSGALGYRFEDETLLRQALTHGSAASAQRGAPTYQRLEFLGDRVLGLAIAGMLLEAFPGAEEGELARRFNALVREETCAAVAEMLDLGSYAIVGKGEEASGGRRKQALLADLCEAVIGAVFADGGYEPARTLVERYWRPLLMAPERPRRDAKTALQEWAQGRGLEPPEYELAGQSGPDHAPRFTVVARLEDGKSSEGTGTTKRDAEQHAAQALLIVLEVWKPGTAADG